MNFYKIIFLLSCILLASGTKEVCHKLSDCKCQHSKGIVDLSSLSGKTFTTSHQGVTYTFFPCQQEKDLGGDCSKAGNNAVCSQTGTTENGGSAETWGTETTAEFLVPDSTNYDIIMVKFSADGKKSDVLLDCPKEGEEGNELDFLQVQGDNLQLRLKSPAACYKPSSPSPSPHTKTTHSPPITDEETVLSTKSKEVCHKLSDCKCQHSKGIVDLSSLSGKMFTASHQGVTYTFFPCQQEKDLGGDCSKAGNNAVCSQTGTTENGGSAETWGTETTSEFLVPDSGNYDIVMVKFSADGKKSDVLLDCPKEGEEANELDFLQVQGDNLQLRLKSPAACYKPSSSSPSPHTKTTHSTPTTKSKSKKTTPSTRIPPQAPANFEFDLSKLGHWYLLAGCLSFISLCVLSYVAVGVAYQRRNGSSGLALVPNLRFWKNFCGLFVDGFLFTFSCFPTCRNSIGVGTGGYVQIQNI